MTARQSCPSTSTEFEHDVFLVEEFDALSINRSKTEEEWLKSKYPAKQHAKKVADELFIYGGIKKGLVYLPGEPLTLFEDSDQSPTFRQRRYFFYLSGANFADCHATYDIEKDHLILWIPYVEPRQVLWYGSTPNVEECMKLYDVDEVRYTDKLEQYLVDCLKSGEIEQLFALHPDQTPMSHTTAKFSIDTTTLLPCMDEARVVKTDYEVAMIRKANDVSSAAHRKVAEMLLTFKNEREVHSRFVATCMDLGAKNQAYAVIAGSGANAATLHYDANDQDLEGNQLLVLDAGCEWNCYASDITRTLPISGKFEPEAAAIYDIVRNMQKTCIDQVKPGTRYYDLHLSACRTALIGLMKLGILRGGSVSDIWNAGTIRAFFPHGLGHHIGLETHDVHGNERLLLGAAPQSQRYDDLGRPRRRPKREPVTLNMLLEMMVRSRSPPPYKGKRILKPNMILTIEPGLYFCREYIEGYFLSIPTHAKFIDKDLLEHYYPVGGVRIEDDILVTETGCENITTAPEGEELLRIINGGDNASEEGIVIL